MFDCLRDTENLDGKGNVEALLDPAQAVAAAYRYDPFGVLLNETSSLTQPFGFSTKRYNGDVGMLHYQYRNYLPEIGRWTTRDPLGEAGGMNLYVFVGNNPVSWVDPWGLMELPSDPSGLGPEWKPDPKHINPNDPNQIRFRDPSGRPLDWHPKKPGASPKTWKGKDHWHDPSNYGKKHLKPGTRIPNPTITIPGPFPIIINPCILEPWRPYCPTNPYYSRCPDA